MTSKKDTTAISRGGTFRWERNQNAPDPAKCRKWKPGKGGSPVRWLQNIPPPDRKQARIGDCARTPPARAEVGAAVFSTSPSIFYNELRRSNLDTFLQKNKKIFEAPPERGFPAPKPEKSPVLPPRCKPERTCKWNAGSVPAKTAPTRFGLFLLQSCAPTQRAFPCFTACNPQTPRNALEKLRTWLRLPLPPVFPCFPFHRQKKSRSFLRIGFFELRYRSTGFAARFAAA